MLERLILAELASKTARYALAYDSLKRLQTIPTGYRRSKYMKKKE